MRKEYQKTIVTSFCLFIAVTAFSQLKVGVFGGPQITSAKYKIEGETQPTDHKYGAQLGATMKVPFENNVYFAPALYYSLKGYKVTLNKPAFPPSDKAINNDVSLHTVEAAALLQYDLSKNPSHFFIKGGFALDFAISGKEKFEVLPRGSVSRNMKFSFGDYGLVTASANFHLGYETANGLIIFAHYAHGIGSMNNADNGPRIFHRIGGISLGYYLRKNPNVLDTRVKQ
jgi:hypothetical protein